jgi:hypothetical protein
MSEDWEQCAKCGSSVGLEYGLEAPSHGYCWLCSTEATEHAFQTVFKLIKEARITRRQSRELRRLKDYSTARRFRMCADTYQKCARILWKNLKGEAA